MYLSDAMSNLGEAFDYAANAYNVGIDDFMRLFISTGYAEEFGGGNPRVVSGRSGTELVIEVFSKAGIEVDYVEPQKDFEYSSEYWCGYILAYAQWKSKKSFKNICDIMTTSEVLSLYSPLHEAPEDKFVDVLYARERDKNNPTRLQKQRKQCGLTQKELSQKSGVNLRTLQQYETRAKDINSAAVSTVSALASVLGCQMKDIVEE